MSTVQYRDQYFSLYEINIITDSEFKILKSNIKNTIAADKTAEDTQIDIIKQTLKEIKSGLSDVDELRNVLFGGGSQTKK